MLNASTTSSKHILKEELELARGLTTKGGGGLMFLTMITARARRTWWRSTAGGRTRSTFGFAFALSNILQLTLCLKGRLVGQLENFMRGIYGEVNT